MKKLLVPFNLLACLILIRFTVSKFAAWPISVAAFQDMAKPLGIDPTFFRISTGFIIGFASLSFLVTGVIILLGLDRWRKARILLGFNTLYATGAMAGALFSEFFLRTSPKMMLVYIALAILGVCLANALTYYRSIKADLLPQADREPATSDKQANQPAAAV